jgi:pimeloyl-ACP methyl ester carboxylesterase
MHTLALLVFATCAAGAAQDVPRGQVIDEVKCAADPSQSYSLYLPSNYTPNRPWSLLMGFHPGARGRAIVDKYRAAAEQYGYIVAGSNNSRNGAWQVSGQAVQAMARDLGQRFAVDERRVYLTGHSGGARVAMQVALGQNRIAGVIASSAGYPDSKPRASVPFVIFGTAGSDDFNFIELRQLDRALKTPHRVVIFEGGHTLPPDSLAMEAIEWMELRAMASGLRARDEALLDKLFTTRERAAGDAGNTPAAVHLLQALAEDFKGLRDVQAVNERASALAKQPDVKRALARERADEDEETRLIEKFLILEAGLNDPERRMDSYGDLKFLLTDLSKKANAATDSPDRSRARRVLRIVTMGASERVKDEDYLKLLQQYRSARPPGPAPHTPARQ